MRLREILSERYRQPIMMVHGTSSKFLRSIMTQGMNPRPKERVWSSDENTGVHSSSRESLSGSYWTSNLMTARSSSLTAVKKFGGDTMLVFALINEQNAFADEDSIRWSVGFAWDQLLKKKYGVIGEAAHIAASFWFLEPKTRKDVIKEFGDMVHDNLIRDETKRGLIQIDYSLMERVYLAYMMRILSYTASRAHNTTYNVFQGWPEGTVPEVPSPQDAEQAMLAALDVLSRRYKESAYKSAAGYSHTLRVNQPIGFRGGNRITGIISFNMREKGPVKLHYGEFPQEYQEKWRESVGSPPEIVKVSSRG